MGAIFFGMVMGVLLAVAAAYIWIHLADWYETQKKDIIQRSIQIRYEEELGNIFGYISELDDRLRKLEGE